MKVPTPGKVGTYEPCEIVETSFVTGNLLGNMSDFKSFFQGPQKTLGQIVLFAMIPVK